MSDFFSAFQSPSPGPVSPGPGSLSRRLATVTASEEEEYERNFFERIFAPFQAPQEGLFKLTKNIAEDGFQMADVWDAFGHAARYFNPWANIQMQDPNEIREIFMGKDAEVNGFLRFGANLAISILYDPLLFAGLGKGLGLLQKGTKAARWADRLTNPAGALLEATRWAAKDMVTPAIHQVGRKILGAADWDMRTAFAAQWVVNRFAGVPEELKRRVLSFDARVADWRYQGYDLIKKADRLGGTMGQRLLTEALETEAVYLARTGAKLTSKHADDLARVVEKLQKSGIDEDLFYQIYDRARHLDDTIGQELFRMGALAREDLAGLRGTHLRRLYSAYEKPLEYINRLEALKVAHPGMAQDAERVSVRALRGNLATLGDEAVGVGGYRAMRPTDRTGRATFQADITDTGYFDPTRRNALDTERFSNDLVGWLEKNSESTVSEVFEHVRHGMLGGVEMSEGFWGTIGDHLSGAKYVRHGVDRYLSRLQAMVDSPGVQWRRASEHLELISKRENLSPELRKALGEVLEFAPRMASEVADVGKLVEVRRMFDEIAGVRRVSEEAGEHLVRAKRFITRGDEVPQQLMVDLRRTIGRDVTPEDILKLDTGSLLERGGSDWASVTQTARHKVKLPDNASFGEAAGLWVNEGTYLMLRGLEGMGAGGTGAAEGAWRGLGHIARNLTTQFKLLKVVLDPTAQFRNLVGNAVLMDMMGTNPFRVDRLIKSASEMMHFMRTGTKGRYLQMLDDAGVTLFENTFTRQELMDIGYRVARGPVTRDTWPDALKSVYRAVADQLGPEGAAARLFELNEGMFKLSVFTDKYEGMIRPLLRGGKQVAPEVQQSIVRQAAALAEQALFNYADVPHLVDFARKYGVVPFFTFPFKAVPYAAETLYKHPHRILKYQRVSEVWNEHSAGGPEDVAREIAGLPRHAREKMVVRMPWQDSQGRPQYIDMSYFLPWEPLREIIEDFKTGFGLLGTPETDEIGRNYGMRGGVLSPPIMVVLDALRHNQDSLGRQITNDSMSNLEKWVAVAKFGYEFWVPPSAPGGSRMESMGRAMQAYARNSPEVEDWVDHLGRGLRMGFGQGKIQPAPGMTPQTQAQVDNPLGPLAGILGGLMGGTMASDPTQARMQEAASFQGTSTDLARQIAQIRSNPDMPLAEKRERIARLYALLERKARATALSVRRL